MTLPQNQLSSFIIGKSFHVEPPSVVESINLESNGFRGVLTKGGAGDKATPQYSEKMSLLTLSLSVFI